MTTCPTTPSGCFSIPSRPRVAPTSSAHKDEAIEIQSEEVYERYMKYLTGCADAFQRGHIDVNQFTLEK